MPMRLDIQVDRSGRVSQLIMLNVKDPELPSPQVEKGSAISTLLTKADSVHVKHGVPVVELVAKKERGEWRQQWFITIPTAKDVIIGSVDAMSGAVIKFNRHADSLDD
ncbi:hypothetical protein NLX86_20705 [Streptomyces sp. A3M-1-3]|uniref:hypothetical protein n=1 Tax=Streptomyces sp. A3M-1-3 TaxID=2962044 RepID=UPI0020B85CDA|nr:hypothetical protein [Streptomyces sp. A3M-1-3]MCP3820428.1 hypothetical protein [Streptomyces sp. A3M-1-3]